MDAGRKAAAIGRDRSGNAEAPAPSGLGAGPVPSLTLRLFGGLCKDRRHCRGA